jgi:hypothetical protein
VQSNNRYNTDTPVLVKEYLRQVGIDVQVKNLGLRGADDAAAQAGSVPTRTGCAPGFRPP